MEDVAALSRVWSEYDQLAEWLVRYLRTSEAEFCALIGTLDDCWDIAENVQTASTRLCASAGVEGGGEARALRDSLLGGCSLLNLSLEHLREAGRELTVTAEKTKGLLDISKHLEDELVPLEYVSFYFLLEASQLSPDDKAMVLTMHAELEQVLVGMRASSDVQRATVTEIVTKLSDATLAVERASSAFANRATASQARIEQQMERLLAMPPGPLEVFDLARSLGADVSSGIREAVKALQGHDAIRQRLEHIALAVAAVRGGQGIEPGHALLLQQRHAKDVLDTILETGSRIKGELRGVAGAANNIVKDSQDSASGSDQALKFEKAIDRLGALGAGLTELLDAEAKMGGFMLSRIEPVRSLVSLKSVEMEELSCALKRLALNVVIGAEHMPSSQGLDVLGAWTTEASERVLRLALGMNEQLVVLRDELSWQADGIQKGVSDLHSRRQELRATEASEGLRKSRQLSYEKAERFSKELASFRTQTVGLKNKLEALLGSLRFVDEGTVILTELDAIFTSLLALYPKPANALDLSSAASGYVTAQQHQVQAALFGGEVVTIARITEAAIGEDFGENVELF